MLFYGCLAALGLFLTFPWPAATGLLVAALLVGSIVAWLCLGPQVLWVEHGALVSATTTRRVRIPFDEVWQVEFAGRLGAEESRVTLTSLAPRRDISWPTAALEDDAEAAIFAAALLAHLDEAHVVLRCDLRAALTAPPR